MSSLTHCDTDTLGRLGENILMFHELRAAPSGISGNPTMSKERTNEPIRKEGRAKGIITQKMVTFRCDVENLDWLEHQANKGRYLNELIAADRAARSMNS